MFSDKDSISCCCCVFFLGGGGGGLLLWSTQVYKFGSNRMRTLLWLSWHVCACNMVTGRNAPQGVEKVCCVCRIDTESNDW